MIHQTHIVDLDGPVILVRAELKTWAYLDYTWPL